MDKPSISLWIDTATQTAKVDFTPQRLQPAEYGIVLSSLFVHIAKEFARDNPGFSEQQIIAELLRGVQAGLSNIQDTALPDHHLH